MAKRIGIIGSGVVGQTLANGFVKHGYDVTIGTNSDSKRGELTAKTGGKAKVASFEDTARFGEIIVIATKGPAAENAVKLAGIGNLAGKVVIDANNPIADAPPVNGVLKFFTSLDDSLMERLQKLAPEARFVKAFSCIGNGLMVNPTKESRPTMFICGNDAAAKQEVASILDQFGHDVADMGKVEAARAIEPLCMLWCIPGLLNNSWTHAFKLLK